MVFVLDNGECVVQWEERRVQDIMTGAYIPYTVKRFGRPVADYDLERLKAAGCVESYDRQFVWLFALPEAGRFEGMQTQERSANRIRTYYINTTLPVAHVEAMQRLLQEAKLTEQFSAQAVEGVLAIFGKDGAPFRRLKDAESAQRYLSQIAPQQFAAAAVAFIESPTDQANLDLEFDTAPLDLDDLIASQTATDVFVGKRALLVSPVGDEGRIASSVLGELGLEIRAAASAHQALELLEDWQPDLLVMDLHMPDMHGWQMLSKARENHRLDQMRVIALADENADNGDQTFALTVAKVDALLIKPVGAPRLRRSIWNALKGNAS
jgi:CheY-like chemotaxis protein